MKYLISTCKFIVALMFSFQIAAGQSMQSPSEFLQYQLGERFTYHHKVLDYFRHVAEQSDRVELYKYGKTYEGRDLMVAYLSSPANLEKLEDIRKNNVNRTGLMDLFISVWVFARFEV